MSGTYLYCQNHECGEYLGSLGGNECGICGWRSPPDQDAAAEIARLSAALSEALAQLEAERARKAPYGTDLEVTAYAMDTGEPGVRLAIEQARSRSGVRWAVRDGFGLVLDKSGLMQDEPFPSARTDEWIAEHRFDTAGEAVAAARALALAITSGDAS